MKLIRLSTTDSKAQFDNIFNDDVYIKKDSKIALLSMAIEITDSILDIDLSNNQIKYQVDTAEGDIIVSLESKRYTDVSDLEDPENIKNLFKDIENKLNDAAIVNTTGAGTIFNKYYGLEWKCSENTKNQVFIKYEIGPYAEFTQVWRYNDTKVERVTGGIWRQTVGQPNNSSNDRSMRLGEFVARGCGFVRCKTNKYVDGDTRGAGASGYIIGLSRINLDAVENPSSSELSYGIAVSTDNTGVRHYYTIIDGAYSQSTTLPNFIAEGNVNNDIQEVIINGPNVELNIFSNGSSTSINLATHDYTPGETLYPFVIFRADNADINSLSLTASSFSVNETTKALLTAPAYTSAPKPVDIITDNYIEMTSSLSNFLGFTNPRVPQIGFQIVTEPTFTAEGQLRFLDRADAYLVELQNLKLESFDGLKNQRKNILAVISNNVQEKKIVYEASTPIFIDLNNSEFLLRNLRCRVVRNDYSPIEMRGEATLVILVDN